MTLTGKGKPAPEGDSCNKAEETQILQLRQARKVAHSHPESSLLTKYKLHDISAHLKGFLADFLWVVVYIIPAIA